MKDRTQLPTQQKITHVKAYALMGNDNDYAFMGQGSLEIVTDTDMIQSQHYIQITNEQNGDIFLRSRLLLSNDYERQKSTLILWNDPEQTLSNYLAISFETSDICDMFWRLICSKIGKNYLEINGREKLDMPNQKNIYSLHEKIKTSYNLVAYHVLNSQPFMFALWETLEGLDKKHQGLKGIEVLRDLLSNFDPKIMELFLSDPNFERFLRIYENECKINFRAYYKQTAGTHELVELSQRARNKMELALRARFVKDCVIDYAKDAMMENMLTQVIKENEIEALINLLQENAIPRIIDVYQKAKKELADEQKNTIRKIIVFFLECVWVLRIHHADNTKLIFLNSFYSSGMLKIIGQMLTEGFFKALQILNCLVVLDSSMFLNEFMNDYRNNSSSNLIRIICKQFSESPHSEFADETINFLRALGPSFIADKKLFEFINKTLLISIFNSCKIVERILPLLLVCMTELNFVKATFEHIIKYNLFKPVAQKMSKKQLGKKEIMDVIKIIKRLLAVNKDQTSQIPEKEVKKMNSYIIESGIFHEILTFFKETNHNNNIIVSSIMQIIITISTMKYNEFVKAIQDYDFGDSHSKIQFKIIQRYLEAIKKIEDYVTQQQNVNISEYDVLRKRQHRALLEEEQEEQYLQQEEKQEEMKQQKTKDILQTGKENIETSIKNLMQLRAEIGNRDKDQSNESDGQADLKDRAARLKAQKEQKDTFELDLRGMDEF